MPLKYFLLFLLLLFTINCFSQQTDNQNTHKKDSLAYVEYMGKAETLYRQNKKKEAKKYIRLAIEAAKHSQIHQLSVRAATTLASYESYEGNFLRTFAILDSLESLIPEGNFDAFTQAIIYDMKSIQLGENGALAQSLSYSQKTGEAMRRANRLKPVVEAILMGNDADNYYQLGLYQKSLFLVLESEIILKKEENLGNLRNPDFSFCITYNNISEVYLALDNVDKALAYALKGKERYDKIGYDIYELKQRNLQVTYKALLAKGDKTAALKLLNERYETILKDDRKNIKERLKAIMDLADYYGQNGNISKAESYYTMAEATVDSISVNKENLFFSYAPITKSYLDRGQLEKVDTYLGIALGNFSPSAVTDPKIALSRDYDFFVKLLSYKGKYFLEKYKKDRKQEDFNASIDWYKAVYYYISFVSQRLGSQLNPKVSYELETITSDFLSLLIENETGFQNKEERFSLAGNVMDFIKSFNLQNNLNRLRNVNLAGIPENLYKHEEILKNRINVLSNKIKKRGADNETLTHLNKSLASLDSLSKKIAQEYPSYSSLNYFEPFKESITTITNTLDAEQHKVSYYYDARNLYTLVIGKKQKKFLKTKVPVDFETAITRYINALKEPKKVKSADGLRKELNEILLKPIEGTDAEKIVIIPYRSLYQLSFETLLDIESLRNKTISYDFSLFKNDKGLSKPNNNEFLIIAPVFSGDTIKKGNGNRKSYSELMYSLREAQEIGNVFDVKSLVHNQATRESFKASLDYKVIHLATHVDMDAEEPLNTKIIFSKNGLQDRDVSLGEIYNSQILSEMVVLSACETGLGKREKGFGIKSLANGFFHAGAKSVVMSLWQVDDFSTSVLMKYFYENLKKGERKDVALQHAKLDYLASIEDDILKHPYYWAGFVVSGDTSPIVAQNYWPWLLGALAILLLIFLFRKILVKRS
ncbi:CHAT domain-containing protein [Flagellimonas sp. S174]|uniref:CHAT domain-containing protein n=1 Tax=Flagellimonas sp. S174 TaxID=3410790 RepID=UPI003BF5DC1C